MPNASDPRLNGNPPGAEIGVLATMLLSGGDRYAALPQVLALGALLVAIAGIARRTRDDPPTALLAALVFAGSARSSRCRRRRPTTTSSSGASLSCAGSALGRTRLDLVLLALSSGWR